MPQDKVKRIHLICGSINTVLIVLLGVALIISCLDIYHSGSHPYSAESIAQHFWQISPLFFLCLLAIVCGIVLQIVLPFAGSRPKASKDLLEAMHRLKAKVPSMTPAITAAVNKQKTFRILIRIGTAFLFAILMVYPALYFLNSNHFTITNVNNDVKNAVCIALIPAFIGLMACYGASILISQSISRETELYKKAILAAKGITPPAPPADKPWQDVVFTAIRYFVLVAACCLIIIGIWNGGMKDVFDKAVAICTECIGLG